MKKEPRIRWQLFVLTPEEKRVVAFVMLMILIGICVKEYRQRHQPPPVRIEQTWAKLPPLTSASPVPSITPRAANDIPTETPPPKRTRKSRERSPSPTPTPADEEPESDSAVQPDNQPPP
jgi:hypothetical protein